jgi:hypothetical protein
VSIGTTAGSRRRPLEGNGAETEARRRRPDTRGFRVEVSDRCLLAARHLPAADRGPRVQAQPCVFVSRERARQRS